MNTVECVKERRSVRNYSSQCVEESLIKKLIEYSIWAPSGKNAQPWRFRVVTNKYLIERLSNLSSNSSWMRNSPCFIFVFLDKNRSYNYIKDIQSCGAVIQTMLLCAHSYGISSCWVGEILTESKSIMEILGLLDYNIELMALVTLGYSTKEVHQIHRKNIDEFII